VEIEVVDRLIIERDTLLLRMKTRSKDQPNNYYDGVLDMYSACCRILNVKKGRNGEFKRKTKS